MNLEELIKSYEEKKSLYENALNTCRKLKHKDSYNRAEMAVEIFTEVINDLKILNGDTVKLVNDWSELENSGLDTKLINWNTDSSTDDTNQ